MIDAAMRLSAIEALEQAINIVKLAGYRLSRPHKRVKDRVGPTFVARYADGQVTRMSTYTSLVNLDQARGERLSRAAYESRTKLPPPPIIASHFEQDGVVLKVYVCD